MGSILRDARIPPPEKVRLIVTSGFTAVAFVLAFWLIIWLIFWQTDLKFGVFRLGPPRGSADGPVALFQDQEVLALNPPTNGDDLLRTDNLVKSIKDYLQDRQGYPSIVYLSAPGLRSTDGDALLAAPEVFRGSLPDGPVDGVALKDVIDAFTTARGKRLLIIDMSQVGTDRDLGAFADDVVERLKTLVPASPGFAVFCSSGARQWSWTSEADRRSVFGQALVDALELEGRKDRNVLNTQALFRGVSARVHKWVEDHRGAVQTPIVLGDKNLFVPFPRDWNAVRADDGAGDEVLIDNMKTEIQEHWKRAYDRDQRGIGQLDPFAWRDYRMALVRAERFWRAGRPFEAGPALLRARNAEVLLETIGKSPCPSLALSMRTIDAGDLRDSLASTTKRLRALIETLPDGPSSDKATTSATAAPTLTDWMRKGAGEWHPYAEGQILDWAARYVKLVGDNSYKTGIDPDAWVNGPNARLIADVIDVRLNAESAAAATFEPHPWVRSLIEKADRDRRAAQDELFGDGNLSDSIRQKLESAKMMYDAAAKTAKAVELSRRVEADLPFLGTWYIRQYARAPNSVDLAILKTIAERANDLNQLLDSGLDPKPGAPPNPPPGLETTVDALAHPFDELKKQFDGEAKSPRDWRSLNDVLGVPMIEPKQRAELAERSVKLAWEESMRPKDAPAVPNKPSELAKIGGDTLSGQVTARSVAGRALAQKAPASGATNEWERADVTPEKPDPAYEATAVGMGLLEWCVLRAGGVPKADLQPLRDVVEKASAGEPYDKASVDSIALKVRALRRHLAETWQTDAGTLTYPEAGRPWSLERKVLERKRLALPAAYERAAAAAFIQQTSHLRLMALLTWHAGRLLEDLDTERADGFLGHIHAFRDAREMEPARTRSNALRAPLRVRYENDHEIVLKDQPSERLAFQVDSDDKLPDGKGVFIVGVSDDDKASVNRTSQGAGRAGAELLAVGSANAGRSWERYVVRKDFDNEEDVSLSVNPAIYYRGRVFTSDPATIRFRLFANANQFSIVFRTRNFESKKDQLYVKREGLKDQHVEHPSYCSLHFGGLHAVDALLTYRPGPADPPLRNVTISASLDGKPVPLAERDRTRALKANKSERISLTTLSADTTPEGGSKLLVMIKRDPDGTTLIQKLLPVNVVDPRKYYEARAVLGAGRLIKIMIHRSREDPVVAEEECSAQVVGGVYKGCFHWNPRVNMKLQLEATARTSIPLLRGETAEIHCEAGEPLGPQLPECKARVGGIGGPTMAVIMPPPPIRPAAPGAPAAQGAPATPDTSAGGIPQAPPNPGGT